jgi:hypothetical protein
MVDDDRRPEKEKKVEPTSQSQTWDKALEIVKDLVDKYPEPMGKVLEAIAYKISGNPEEIKAEAKLATYTTLGFIGLMIGILVATSALAFVGRLSGETVAFIFGTAFGSIITFLYRYLAPRPEED